MDDKDIIDDLRRMIADLETRPLAEANELAHGRLLALSDRYRPRFTQPTEDDYRREIAGMKQFPAIAHLRSKTGLGLREAASLYDRLTRSP